MILFLCAQDLFSFFSPMVLKDAWSMMFLYKYCIEV